MGIEEKARAYDKALKQAKKELNTCGSLDCDAARQIFRFFPELRESEDERIRKKLIKTIGYFRSRGIDQQLCEEFLAYLEKQKEEEGYEAIPVESTLEYKLGFKAGKESEKQKSWSKEDEMYLSQAIETLEHENYPILANKLKFLRPHWKPSEEPESVAERFARIVRANLSKIDKEVQQEFEHLYYEITGNKMYGGYND